MKLGNDKILRYSKHGMAEHSVVHPSYGSLSVFSDDNFYGLKCSRSEAADHHNNHDCKQPKNVFPDMRVDVFRLG